MTKREYHELKDQDVDLSGEPDEFIATGITDSSVAMELHLYYVGDVTWVVTVGEFNNALPHWTQGTITPEEAVADYLDECRDMGQIE